MLALLPLGAAMLGVAQGREKSSTSTPAIHGLLQMYASDPRPSWQALDAGVYHPRPAVVVCCASHTCAIPVGDQMNYVLNSKVALIVGGTTGIGLATAKAFASAGTTVVVASRNSGKGAAAIAGLTPLSADVAFFECDVSNASSVTHLLDSILSQFGKLDCAVNCAAYDFKLARAHEVPEQEIAKHLAVDVQGLFTCMRAEIGAMLQGKGGTIVNVASTTGLSGTPTAALYSAGKHAVIGLTRSTAKEYIGDGIRINAVCPGVTNTQRRERRTSHLSSAERSEQDQALAMEIPIGRPATANEIANAILWLSSPMSSYVVGHSLVIDGGLTA